MREQDMYIEFIRKGHATKQTCGIQRKRCRRFFFWKTKLSFIKKRNWNTTERAFRN